MKLLNNTSASLHWDTKLVDGGGDCGDIAPNSPPTEIYPSMNLPFSLTVVLSGPLKFDGLTENSFVEIQSNSREIPPAKK